MEADLLKTNISIDIRKMKQGSFKDRKNKQDSQNQKLKLDRKKT